VVRSIVHDASDCVNRRVKAAVFAGFFSFSGWGIWGVADREGKPTLPAEY
jgi:hypothetical protein